MTKGKSSNNQNGKGDSPRSNLSKQFQDNYSKIKWKSAKNKSAKNKIDKNKKNKYN